ncbi:MAG: flagellar basal-body MS-ring/collar protein FliF [Candidatus Saganbacteria bacterium]|nr:flagellar basal-body MS-ring/collar protein FliF [Candidatus Saganbacteria bacterium]
MAERINTGRSRNSIVNWTIAIIVLLALVLVFLPSCGTVKTKVVKDGPETWPVLFSNLDLKDSSAIIAELHAKSIKSDIRDGGRTIAVSQDKVSEALALAQKAIPRERVGWEIFDQSKLGATDFDRRIQLIRATSGEISKIIASIDVVDDAWVQIVIPETRLFAAAQAPVTASVLVRLKPEKELSQDQITGIINLVASSVENLNTANVTIVDIHGNLLTGRPLAKIPEKVPSEALEKVKEKEAFLKKKEEELSKKEEAFKEKVKEVKKVSTAEENAELRLKMKKDLEDNLTTKAQTLLNQFYPPNSAILKVTVALQEENIIKKPVQPVQTLKIKKITAIVLVDNRLELTSKLKQDTYKTVQVAVGYDRKRGDQIILRAVPFHLAVPPKEKLRIEAEKVLQEKVGLPENIRKFIGIVSQQGPVAALKKLAGKPEGRNALIIGGAVVGFIIIFLILRSLFMGGPVEEEVEEKEAEAPKAPERTVLSMETVKDVADRDPEKMAELLKRWLSEEG